MAKGVSLHIGVNHVDPAHYQGWDGALAACEYDAKDMAALAKKQGFRESGLLLSEQATAAAVIEAIQAAAKKLAKGDLFLLTYSGHGGQVPDTNRDEEDRKDETWVLYDRQLIDDELYGLYAQFKSGVRVLVLSDSCHSGTVTKELPPWEAANQPSGPAARFMPPRVGAATYRKSKAIYDGIQKRNKAAETIEVKATVLLISGCQDNQLSLDGDRNGLFTGNLRKVWNNGRFKYGYRRFRDTIVSRMPATQSPNYFLVGAPNLAFEGQKPFTI